MANSLNIRNFVLLTVTLIGLVVTCVNALSLTGPLHASCKITWKFGESCQEVKTAIKGQITKWESADNCKQGGEKCLYKILSEGDTNLRAQHETPVKHYTDTMNFDFAVNGNGCDVKGSSTSDTWYAVLDYGTNYCNLENLITGSGLDKVTGYSESTNNDVCTQFSTADCEKY